MVVHNLIGTSGPALWRKLAPWVEMLREEQEARTMFEWFQWLAERLESNQAPNENPAYEAHRNWMPANLTSKL
jgi:hypothetical protein